MDYDENYETCNNTYLTLRVYTGILTIKEITDSLGLEPTEHVVKGRKSLIGSHTNDFNGWFYSTKDKIASKDNRQHVDYITTILLPISTELKKLQHSSVEIYLSCFWQSVSGQGGPTLSAKQLADLAKLGIELQFDIY